MWYLHRDLFFPLWGRLFDADAFGHYLAGIEFYQHRGIALELLDGNGQSKVVENEELELQVIKFGKRQTTNLENVSDLGKADGHPDCWDIPWHILNWCKRRPKRIYWRK